jgi:glycosidase
LQATVALAAVLRERLEAVFREQPGLVASLVEEFGRHAGEEAVERALRLFAEMAQGDDEAQGEPDASTDAGRRAALTELLLYWSLSSNPASAAWTRRLLDPEPAADRAYLRLAGALEGVVTKPSAPWAPLAKALVTPARVAPDSLSAQLRLLLEELDAIEPSEERAVLSSLDHIAEEEAPRFPPGPGPIELPDYEDLDLDTTRYSDDRGWMERLVLLAKNCYVWLAQLSRDYGRDIRRLDQIPDRELDRLAEWGITGLWLIGVWERSSASARIKQLLGNREALASAYSLHEYEIAAELGGDEALATLRAKALERGIRLAADMVPNHLGIDSRWVVEHPQRFLSAEHCPFPGYTFEGPDLSSDPRVGIYLEDHYFDRTDAAVVFKRVDRPSGDARFIYHGNDGTSTPWNDTAQLDYLREETREAVIQEILAVAKRFAIIRFDAAMTLARRHIQRLWYPQPGSGGAIPSRAEHALTAAQFKEALPNEFWSEVVDRIAEEAPDTLLLAEAFWLMEGYFVRSLGMHRVYNSAFMNLLRDGDNMKLRSLIQETLDFDPQILRRHVNFLSNPDEETAAEQFGRDDRYFGACVTMATLPGLPLVAHGQFEGHREKYGMEFRRPQLEEEVDAELFRRHRREIFPLLRRRDWFAGVETFRLHAAAGSEDILAYTNGSGPERSLVLFNNSAQEYSGQISELSDLVELSPGSICRFRDRTSGLHYLATAEELAEGALAVELGPFESRVLVDFRPVLDAVQEQYRALAVRLGRRGARSLEIELGALELEGVQLAVADLLEADSKVTDAALDGLERALADLEAPRFDAGALRSRLVKALAATARVANRAGALPWPASERMTRAERRTLEALGAEALPLAGIRCLSVLEPLRPLIGAGVGTGVWERLFARLLTGTTAGAAHDAGEVESEAMILAVALEEVWLAPAPAVGRDELGEMLNGWLARAESYRLTGLNRHRGEEWVRKEQIDRLLARRGLCALCGWLLSDTTDREEAALGAIGWVDSVDSMSRFLEGSGYSVAAIRELLGKRSPA